MGNTQRLGVFTLARTLIQDEPEIVKAIMGSLIVVRAELHYSTDTIEYVALCDEFEPVPAGMTAPAYDLEVDLEAETITFKKIGD